MIYSEEMCQVLAEIESWLLERDMRNAGPVGYTDDGFRAACKLFMSVMMDRMWRLQENETIPMKERMGMAQALGEELRTLIKTYADIDTHSFYKTEHDG